MIQNLFQTDAGTVAAVAAVLAALALAGVVVLLVRQQWLRAQYRRFMTGATGANLESLLRDHVAQMGAIAEQLQAVDQLARRLEAEGRFAVQHLGVVRYNPFRDTGGDQSFAVALADAHGNGVVLSSLHARDVTRVYAKPLTNWVSGHTLTDEEKQAIAAASQKRSR